MDRLRLSSTGLKPVRCNEWGIAPSGWREIRNWVQVKLYKVISRSLLPADDSVDRLGCAAHGHGHAPPRTAPRRCGSSGDGVRSACCAIASSSSDPPAPDSFTNLHAAACAMLCGGQRAQHLMPSPSVPRVHTDDFAAPRNAPHTRCTWWPRSACLFCTSGIRHSSRRAVRRTHSPSKQGASWRRSLRARTPGSQRGQ